jgi:acyl-CoA hydrolase
LSGQNVQFISARAAALLGRDAKRILIAGCAAEPLAILRAVADEPDLWQGRCLTGAFIPGVNDHDFSALGQGTRVETIFMTAGLRDGAGEVAHLPLHYSAYWDRLARPGIVDLIYATVPPPRADRTLGLGIAADFTPAAIAAGARIIGVVNPAMPDVPDGPRLPLERFSALVADDTALPTLAAIPPDASSLAIADHIAGLLRPGDTLQLGLGKLQAAVLQRAADAGLTDLSYHAGMLSDGMIDAAQVFSGGIVTGTALGSAELYRRVTDLPGLRFAPVGQTHAIATLAAIKGFVSVNSVLEVDLSGQANAEALAGRQISGQGGLVDFLRGARASQGGRAILALPATAAGGRQSRIVARLAPGTPVTVARADVDLIVTEFGVADLREASIADRAIRIAAVAAPSFRESLLGVAA